MEKILNMVISYVESAAKDEYNEIAQTIKHDLIFSEHSEDLEKFIRYISNTSNICGACKGSYPAQAVLVSLNTGEFYLLDFSEPGINPKDYLENTLLIVGYDEISQISIHISKGS